MWLLWALPSSWTLIESDSDGGAGGGPLSRSSVAIWLAIPWGQTSGLWARSLSLKGVPGACRPWGQKAKREMKKRNEQLMRAWVSERESSFWAICWPWTNTAERLSEPLCRPFSNLGPKGPNVPCKWPTKSQIEHEERFGRKKFMSRQLLAQPDKSGNWNNNWNQ